MLSERQIRIINMIIKSSEPLKIQDLATAENVSLQTMYSDLRIIGKTGFSTNRGRAGVVFSEDEESTVGQKIAFDRAIREKACAYAIDSILNGNPKGVLFLDGGSTGYLFFEELRKRGMRDLIIVTNNPIILGALQEDESFFYQNNVFATGGRLDPMRISLYSIGRQGDFTPMRGEGSLVDICILGFRAVSAKGDLYIDNEEEVNQKKNLIAKSRRLILIVTSSKLETTGLFKIASLSKEAKSKEIGIIAASNGSFEGTPSATLKALTDLLGESSINIIS